MNRIFAAAGSEAPAPGAGLVQPASGCRGGFRRATISVSWAIGVIKSWFDAGRPFEFHLYQNGGHGFGLGYPNRTSNAGLKSSRTRSV